MLTLSTSQIKAGRALLGWTQEDLADASDIGPTAVRSLEMGYRPRHSTMDRVRAAFEDAGLEFIAGDGVRRRNDAIKIYEGHDNCDKFFADVLETARRDSGNVLVSIMSQDILTQPCGTPRKTNLERLELLHELAPVKCLLSNALSPSLFTSLIEMRTAPTTSLGMTSCVVYGNRYAEIIQETRYNFLVVVFSIAAMATDYRKQFVADWNASLVRAAPSVRAAV